MDKIAIISDIHANLTALQAVLKDIENRNISKIYCLGDIVSKGVNPDSVIDLVRKNCEIILKGNCDEIYSSELAFKKKFWTTMKIGEDRANFLKKLPVMYEFYLSGNLIRLFHASPYSLEHIYNPIYSNENTKYVNHELKTPNELFKNTEFIGRSEKDKIPDIVGYAHLHMQNLFQFEDKIVFNTGSISLANNPSKSSYTILEGILDSKEKTTFSITNVNIYYDILKEIKYIENSDIPTKEELILTLRNEH